MQIKDGENTVKANTQSLPARLIYQGKTLKRKNLSYFISFSQSFLFNIIER